MPIPTRRPLFLDLSHDPTVPAASAVVRPAAFAQPRGLPHVRPLFAASDPADAALDPLEPALEPLEPFGAFEALDALLPGGPSDPDEPPPDLAPIEPPPPAPVISLTHPPGPSPEMLARLDRAVGELARRAAALGDHAARDAVDLGLELARRLLQAEIAARPEALLPALREAASRLAASRALTIRLHPDDLAALPDGRAAEALGLHGVAVRVEADPSLQRCDCVIEDSAGATVDATLEGRLRRVRAALVVEAAP